MTKCAKHATTMRTSFDYYMAAANIIFLFLLVACWYYAGRTTPSIPGEAITSHREFLYHFTPLGSRGEARHDATRRYNI